MIPANQLLRRPHWPILFMVVLLLNTISISARQQNNSGHRALEWEVVQHHDYASNIPTDDIELYRMTIDSLLSFTDYWRISPPKKSEGNHLLIDSVMNTLQGKRAERLAILSIQGTEPDNYPTGLTATASSYNQIDLSWTDATGTTLPDGYLIAASTTQSFTPPTDGEEPVIDTDLSDGQALIKMTQGVESYSFVQGLSESTTYYFIIWPYKGADSEIDYKTDGTPPETQATTEARPLVVINEILADPNQDANGDAALDALDDQFIELINTSGSARNLSGWTVQTNAGQRHTIPANTLLPDGAALIIFGGGSLSADFAGSLAQKATQGSLDLAPTGDQVVIKDDQGTTQASYNYSGEANDNQSITRSPDKTGSFVKHTDASTAPFSPGTALDGSGFYQQPSASSGNWSVVFASANSSSNLRIPEGYQVTVSSSNMMAAASNLVIEAGGQLTIDGTLTVSNESVIRGGEELSATVQGSANLVTGEQVYVTQALAATNQAYNWHYLGVPLAGVTAGAFPGVVHNSQSVYAAAWNETLKQYSHLGSSDALTAGTGYAVPADEASIALFAGSQLQSSDFNFTDLTYTAGTYEGFHLLGNPYMAALDADALTGTNWTQDVWVRVDGDFKSWQKGGTGTLTNGLIPALQGFWIQVTQSDNAFSMATSHTLHNDAALYKNQSAERPQVMLQLQGSGGQDEMVIYTHQQAQPGFDVMDVEKWLAEGANIPQIYSKANEKKLEVDGQTSFASGTRLPLYINIPAAGKYTLTWQDEHQWPGQQLYLYDRLKDQYIHLAKNESIDFQVTATKNDWNRWDLLWKDAFASGVETVSGESLQIFSRQRQLVLNSAKPVQAALRLYDISGRLLVDTRWSGAGEKVIPVEKPGVYLIHIKVHNKLLAKKIILH